MRFLLLLLLIGSHGYGADKMSPECVRALMVAARRGEIVVTPGDIEAEVAVKTTAWRKELRGVDEQSLEAKLVNYDIASYAKSLIRSYQNEKFLELYSQIKVPVNLKFDSYRSYLLEDAIMAKNYEIYQFLNRLFEKPRIAAWTTLLAKQVVDDPIFSKDAMNIRYESGEPFSSRVVEYGRIIPRKLEYFSEVAQSRNMEELFNLIKDLYPSGSLLGFATRHGKKSNAELEFQVTDNSVAIDIYDSSLFQRRRFGWSSPYKLTTPFVLSAQSRSKIDEMEVTKSSVRIVIVDENAHYQELVLNLDKDMIRTVQISTRNKKSLQAQWNTQVFEVVN